MQEKAHRYFVLNKPYGMVSQFVSTHNLPLLGDLPFSFPEDTHAIGRLDAVSEGLLLLTTNKKITRLLFSSPVPHKRTYLVQVKNKVSAESLEQLRSGVPIIIERGKTYTTPPCPVELAAGPPPYPSPRIISPYVETTWLQLTLTEGKFRQVRKMVASVHHRCIRLIRTSIEDLELGNLQPGCIRELDEETFFRLLKLDSSG